MNLKNKQPKTLIEITQALLGTVFFRYILFFRAFLGNVLGLPLYEEKMKGRDGPRRYCVFTFGLCLQQILSITIQ